MAGCVLDYPAPKQSFGQPSSRAHDPFLLFDQHVEQVFWVRVVRVAVDAVDFVAIDFHWNFVKQVLHKIHLRNNIGVALGGAIGAVIPCDLYRDCDAGAGERDEFIGFGFQP